MKPDEAKEILRKAKQLSEMVAELCKEGDGINNQTTMSVVMLAAAIMTRFFEESPERMHALYEVMVMGTENLLDDNPTIQ